jgi:hypothetical protein
MAGNELKKTGLTFQAQNDLNRGLKNQAGSNFLNKTAICNESVEPHFHWRSQFLVFLYFEITLHQSFH